MQISQYLDSTYLKTAKQAKISNAQNAEIITNLINQAIQNNIKLVMLLPNEVANAKKQIIQNKASVLIGTVINFPLGNTTIQNKLSDAKTAIKNGADELDFVINYQAFIAGEINLVKTEVLQLSTYCLNQHKTIKFIIETAALSLKQIIQICALIKNTITQNFKENQFEQVFIKSSTGFFETQNNIPNGATLPHIIAMLENGSPLPIKASGGIKTQAEALNYIKLGVKRLGTSAALNIINNQNSTSNY